MLVMLVAGEADDEDVATVACHDIGEFVRHYPNGRAIAKRLGAKDISIMQPIEHDNEELRRQALTCVSKRMVQNWSVRLIRFLLTESRDNVDSTDNFLSYTGNKVTWVEGREWMPVQCFLAFVVLFL